MQTMMKQARRLSLIAPVLVILILTLVSCCGGRLNSIALCLRAPYSDPPASFDESDLVGTWETRYGPNVDTLVLRAGGTFRQTYGRSTPADYVFETPWNEWWVERLANGGVRLHLDGARYYPEGPIIAELDGEGYPCPEDEPDCPERYQLGPYDFYDPIADETVYNERRLPKKPEMTHSEADRRRPRRTNIATSSSLSPVRR